MAIIDLIILGFVALGAFKGYKRGLIVEAFSILAFLISIIIGFKFLDLGSEAFSEIFGLEAIKNISPYLSFFVVLFASSFLLKKMSWMLRKAIRLTFLGSLDGLGGAFIGGFTSLMGISILLWILSKTGISLPQKWFVGADFYDFTVKFAPNIISQISDYLPGGNWIDKLKGIGEKSGKII